MAIWKSDLHFKFWASGDELRGMDAGQYKDYLFTDKCAGRAFAPNRDPRRGEVRRHGCAQGQVGHRRQHLECFDPCEQLRKSFAGLSEYRST